jgi:hypothetical protein
MEVEKEKEKEKEKKGLMRINKRGGERFQDV